MADEQTAQALSYTRPAPKPVAPKPAGGTPPPPPPRRPAAPTSTSGPATPAAAPAAPVTAPAPATAAPKDGWAKRAIQRITDPNRNSRAWINKHPKSFGTAAAYGTAEAVRQLANSDGDISDAPAAAAAAFTQVPIGKTDWLAGGVLKNIFAGIGTAMTGAPSSLAPVWSEKDLFSPEMLKALPGIEAARAARAQFAADLKAGVELGASLSNEGLDSLLARNQTDYSDGMSRIPQAAGLDRDKALKALNDTRDSRLQSLSSAPGFRERLDGNAVRVAQMVLGTSDAPDLWTDEQKSVAGRIREDFGKQSLGEQMYPDFGAMQKEIDAARTAQ